MLRYLRGPLRRRIVVAVLTLYTIIGLSAVVWMAEHYTPVPGVAQTQPAPRTPGFWRYWMLQRELAPVDLQQ